MATANQSIESVAMCRAASALLMLWLAGCGGQEAGPSCQPVSGQVHHNGKPLVEGMVFFHPLDSTAATVQRPMAVTDQQGRFELTTFRIGDGAPLGRYAITVELRELREDGDEMVRDGPNLLPKKYQSPQTTDLTFTVGSGENELPLIDLK